MAEHVRPPERCDLCSERFGRPITCFVHEAIEIANQMTAPLESMSAEELAHWLAHEPWCDSHETDVLDGRARPCNCGRAK